MGRPWWYDSYWERQDKPPGGKSPRNRQSSSIPGCLIVFLVIFVLLLGGLVTWALFGSQIASFFDSLNSGTQPAVTQPLIESPPSKAPVPPITPPPFKPTTVPAPEPAKTLPTQTIPSPPVEQSAYSHEQLIQYALQLINKDRAINGLSPVVVGNNSAAQKHAEERLANRYLSHWGKDGLKPYMRYTLAGGLNYEAENGFMTETIWFGGRDSSYIRDPKEMLEQAQQGLMDSPGHRRNILDKWHKKVNLGIAYDEERLDLVQQFEGDYINFSKSPSISGSILSMAGEVNLGTIENVSLYYDPLPQPLSPQQLEAPPYDYAYGLGEDIGTILPPLPPDYFYIDLLPNDVIATTWDTDPVGLFAIEADISPMLEEGKGVYTVVVWVETDGEFVSISNYSIFIK